MRKCNYYEATTKVFTSRVLDARLKKIGVDKVRAVYAEKRSKAQDELTQAITDYKEASEENKEAYKIVARDKAQALQVVIDEAKEAINATEHFELDDSDKALITALNKLHVSNEEATRDAIKTWATAQGCKWDAIAGTTFESILFDCISIRYNRAVDVSSNGAVVTTCNGRATVTALYLACYEALVAGGVLTAKRLPTILSDKVQSKFTTKKGAKSSLATRCEGVTAQAVAGYNGEVYGAKTKEEAKKEASEAKKGEATRKATRKAQDASEEAKKAQLVALRKAQAIAQEIAKKEASDEAHEKTSAIIAKEAKKAQAKK